LAVKRNGVPVVETARLRLRGHRLDDLDECMAMWADPIVTRFIGGKPSTQQQTWARVLGYVGHWSLLGFGYWAIEEKASGRFIGEIGFADFKREIAAPMKDVPEPVGHSCRANTAAVSQRRRRVPSSRGATSVSQHREPYA